MCNIHTTWNVALHGRATILYFDKLIFGFPLNETGACSLLGKTAPARDDNVGHDTNLQLIEYLGSGLAIPYAKEAISSTRMYSD